MSKEQLLQINKDTLSFLSAIDVISRTSPEIAQAIVDELQDQRNSLKLIASENYADVETLLAMGNWLTDKYAEGSVGHRFYAGCQNVDTVEQIASDKAKELFGAENAYVQPHSGIDANLVAYWAILAAKVEQPAVEAANVKNVNEMSDEDWDKLRHAFGNQKVMGLSLDSGGHLTHGFRPNISGKMFEQYSYGVDPETGVLDYDQIREQAKQVQPLILVAGYSAYPRKVNFRIMKEIADEVGAVFMVDMAHFAGLVAGKVFTGDFDPVAHADIVTSTTHKTLRGPRGGLVLCKDWLNEFVLRGCPLVLGGPLPHVMAAKAVAFEKALQNDFQVYAQQVVANAAALADELMKCGAKLTSDGTDNHLMVLDCTSYGLTGRHADGALLDSGIVTNRNTIPNDPNGAWYTSGVRIGTPALTTRGMKEDDFREIAHLIDEVLRATKPEEKDGKAHKAKYILDFEVSQKVKKQINEMLLKYPLYPTVEI
ncbi:MAG: glycine hydroxymethyltransferase [Acidimicrobiia bacterium]